MPYQAVRFSQLFSTEWNKHQAPNANEQERILINQETHKQSFNFTGQWTSMGILSQAFFGVKGSPLPPWGLAHASLALTMTMIFELPTLVWKPLLFFFLPFFFSFLYCFHYYFALSGINYLFDFFSIWSICCWTQWIELAIVYMKVGLVSLEFGDR